jgi:putative ABC transport system substrate-binding protein
MVGFTAPAHGDEPSKPARVGFVSSGARQWLTKQGVHAGFLAGMTRRGYVLGRTFLLEERFAEGHQERIPGLIHEVLTLNVDVLVTMPPYIAQIAQQSTPKVPIVTLSDDPVGTGLVKSLSHPGGDITGVSIQAGDYSAKWLELLKEAVPNLHKVAVVDNHARQIDELRKAAPVLGLELEILSGMPSDMEKSMSAIAAAAPDGLVVGDDGAYEPIQPQLLQFAQERHLPTIGGLGDTFVYIGGLMSYSCNYYEVGQRVADQVDRILKGAHPSDLPIDQATEFLLKLNLRTAKELDVTMPASLLARADEVIE